MYMIIYAEQDSNTTIIFFDLLDEAEREYFKHGAGAHFFWIMYGCVEEHFPKIGTLQDVPLRKEIILS